MFANGKEQTVPICQIKDILSVIIKLMLSNEFKHTLSVFRFVLIQYCVEQISVILLVYLKTDQQCSKLTRESEAQMTCFMCWPQNSGEQHHLSQCPFVSQPHIKL
jgi:hypothetical protein